MPTDIDECASGVDDCHSSASCINTVGSYSCLCNDPFTGDGRTCSHSSPGNVMSLCKYVVYSDLLLFPYGVFVWKKQKLAMIFFFSAEFILTFCNNAKLD